MNSELQKLHDVWMLPDNKPFESTELPQMTFDDLTNSIINFGPFYYYIVDFYDMSLSHVSSSITQIHGYDPLTVTFNDILATMHPEDVEFAAKAESTIADFCSKNIRREKLLKYKVMYNLRGRLANGEYVLFNHQAIMLTLDSNGGFGKSLNIHTRIDHLSNNNNYKCSLIGLNGEPSYMNISAKSTIHNILKFTKREIDVIKCIANGLNNNEIAEKLFISGLTVKKHRDNIMVKSGSKNSAQLVKTCILQGLI